MQLQNESASFSRAESILARAIPHTLLKVWSSTYLETTRSLKNWEIDTSSKLCQCSIQMVSLLEITDAVSAA